MRLGKLLQLKDMSGRLRPNIDPNLAYFSHCINAGWVSDANLEILTTRVYGEI